MTATIATCVKDEEQHLIEWIAWHRLCGFDEIVVYDNASKDGTFDLLCTLGALGVIHPRSVYDAPRVRPQIAAFTDESKRPSKTDWVMFSDVDEFLVIRDASSIGAFLAGFPSDVAQICFNWKLFGSSGHEMASDRPTVERFTRASVAADVSNCHVKAITRRSHIEAVTTHAPILKGGLRVHDDGAPAVLKHHGLADRISHQRAYLNHYILKSRAEFSEKMARGKGDEAQDSPGKFRPDAEAFWQRHNSNAEECLIAKARLPALEAEMSGLRDRIFSYNHCSATYTREKAANAAKAALAHISRRPT